MAPDSSRIAGKLVLSTALVIAGLLAFAPTLLDSYVIGLMTRAFCFALLVISVDLLWGYTGILSLGQSAFFGIGAYGIGIAFTHVTGSWLGMALGFIGGILVAVVIAAALAWFTFYARISLIFPFYVSVVTLSVAVVFYQVVLSGGELTGSSQGLSGFKSVEISQLSWYWILLATLAMFGYLGHQLVTSDAGTVLVSIRENEERCRYLGYNTPRIKAMLFIACAVLAAVSGSFYAVYTTIVAPSLVGFTLGTDAVIWTALGGRGTIIGPVIGAILINVIGPALNARFPFLWQLFLGILFVTVVTLAPRGLLPMLSHLGLPRHRLAENPPIGDTITHHKEKQSAVGDVRPKLSSAEALRVVDVTKHFGSLDVLRGVNLGVMRGELLSIVGPNGAGKTTLIRCIADGAERSTGDIFVDGADIGLRDPDDIVMLGVGRKFQAANVFDSLTVADCLRLASWKGRLPSMLRKSHELDLPQPVWLVLEATGLSAHLDQHAGTLGHGLRQGLELAMVLALEPSVLLLDEPTAGLTREERSKIAGVLSGLRESGGLCIILTEHDFDFVKQISTRMVVLHQGEVVMDGSVDQVANSEVVRSIYLGHGHEQSS